MHRVALLRRNSMAVSGYLSFVTVTALATAGCAPDTRSPEVAPISTAASPIRALDADFLRGHMSVLADDGMEGRETGTPGFDRAARYVADEFRRSKLESVQSGYFQRLAIRRMSLEESTAFLSVTTEGRPTTFTYAEDYVTYGFRGASTVNVEGSMVFVGDGVSVASRDIDAYRDLDVVGKLVVAVAGAPTSLSPSEQSFYGDPTQKAADAARRGATALFVVDSPQIPWELRVRAARQLGANQVMSRESPSPAIPIVYLARHAAAAIVGPLGSDRAPGARRLPGVSARLGFTQHSRDVRSANVVARLPGRDPSLQREHVVVMAHLDHMGVGAPVDGDAIYNGAVDNASGVAALLAMAEAFVAAPRRPARSLLFLATTGEEQGLLGAEFFVGRRNQLTGSIVAAINIDGTSVTPFESLELRGGANSSLGAIAESVGRQLGVAVQNEPLGVGGSDHSPFLLAGIPPLWVGAALPENWMATYYHTPRDDMRQPLDLGAAARYAQFVYLTTYLAADAAARPSWTVGEFFAEPRANSSSAR